MQLSTAIPIVIAAIVIVIRSRGIDSSPIVPSITKHAIRLGVMAAKAVFKDLNKKNSIKKIPKRTMDNVFIWESNRL